MTAWFSCFPSPMRREAVNKVINFESAPMSGTWVVVVVVCVLGVEGIMEEVEREINIITFKFEIWNFKNINI